MKQAKSKVWKTADGKLVKDGHEDAHILVAAEGQLVPDTYVEGFDNASTFFSTVNAPAPEPATPAPSFEDFKPGQSNVKEVKGLPKDAVGPVKELGGATVTGKVGDHEAMISNQKPAAKLAKKATKGKKSK
jgi:hypothetical protein